MNDSSQPRLPVPFAETAGALATTEPVQIDAAEPRWSRERMAEFIVELAATQSVALAARSVGMSRQSAYRLRAREEGEAFDLAWEIALERGYEQLYRAALTRAVSGTEVPVYQRGELVGTRRHFDERLTCFLLARGKHGSGPLPRERRAALDSWTGRFAELVEQVRMGAAPEEGGGGESA